MQFQAVSQFDCLSQCHIGTIVMSKSREINMFAAECMSAEKHHATYYKVLIYGQPWPLDFDTYDISSRSTLLYDLFFRLWLASWQR